MPSKKKRAKLAKKKYKKRINKGIYLITEQKTITQINDIICDICKNEIICDCRYEQDKQDQNRMCAERRKKQHEFPLSQYTIKGKNCDTYLIHICSKICNEKFNLIFVEYINQLKKYHHDED